MKMERIRTVYDKTNIKIAHNTSDCEQLTIPTYPRQNIEGRLRLKFDELRETFNSTEQCAAWLFPEMNLDFAPVFDGDLSSFFEPKRIETEPSEQYKNLLTEVINQTTSPSYVYGIAVSFMADIIGIGRLIVIDWHLGENDWTAGCDDLHVLDQNQLEQCKQRRIYRKTATAANGLGGALVKSINSDDSSRTSVYMTNIDEELAMFLTQQ